MPRTLGDSDMEISPIGLGTWAIGGEWAFGWGPQDDARSIAAIRRAVDAGINWIDTAPIYGYGHAEKIVARALREIDRDRRPYVFTKCSLIWDDRGNVAHSLRAKSIRAEVDASLHRLEVDVLDLCQIHWPARPPFRNDDRIEEAWTELAELRERGKVRHIGVSNFDASQLERLARVVPVTSLQPPYSMLMRQIEDEILPYCQEHGIGVIVYSPLHNGLLSGAMTRERIDDLPDTDWRKTRNPAFREPHLTKNLELVDLLREIGGTHGRSPGEVAIAWALHHPAVTGAIVGARDSEQVDGFVAAMEFRLTDDEYAAIGDRLPDSIEMMERG
jgi:aryl-alcohol dehydrogenase-like predicted oxidoreductase